LELFEEQSLIFDLQAKHKKPADLMPLLAKRNAHAEAAGKVKQKDLKAPPHHMAVICDAMGIFGNALLGNDDDSKEFYKETCGAVQFPANKILKLDKEPDTKWVNSITGICKAHFDFVMGNFAAQLEWKGSADVNLADALSKGVQSAPAQQVQAPAPEVKKAAPAGPKKPVKREPSKQKQGRVWNFADYDGVNITNEGEELVDKSLAHAYYSCKNMEIIIKGKLKSVNLEGCQKVTIWVDKLISEINLMNCKVVKIFAQEQVPTCTVENCSEINLMLNHKTKGCKLYTTCARAMWVQWPKDGADDTDYDQVNWHR